METSILTKPLELSGNICNLLGVVQHHASFFQLMQIFNFKPGIISFLLKFHGLDSRNPYLHFEEFEEVCATFHDQSCNKETIRLKLFPFSLKDKEKSWLNSLRPRSIGTWQEMQTEFLKKFCPIHMQLKDK